jgi:ABC-type glycerol-3-phosphate transport system substrate-binding protein
MLFNRKKSKRLLATLAIAAVSVLGISGCATTSAEDNVTSAEDNEITVFLIQSPTADAIKARIPEFTAETGIKVNVVDAPYDDAHQKMLLSFNSQQGAYDVVQFDNPYLAPFASQGTLAALDDYIQGSAEYDIADFVPALQEYGKYEGQTYGLNLSTEPFLLWYRTDIYKELNLNVPTTWDEYLANAKAIQASGKASGQVIANASSVNSWWWLQLVWSFGGDLTDASGNPSVNSDAAAKATDFMKELLEVSPQSAVTATGDDATTLFTTQDVGQMINYSGYAPVIMNPETSKYTDTIAAATIPSGVTNIIELTGWNIGVPADSKKQANAWKFLEWLLSKNNTPKLMDAGAAAIGRTSIVNNAEITAKSPYIAMLGPAAETGRRLPALTQWAEISNQIGVAVQDILTGKTSTAEGLDALNDQLAVTLGK